MTKNIDIIKSPIQLLILPIVFFHTILDLFLTAILESVSCVLLHYLTFSRDANIEESLLLVSGRYHGDIIIHPRDLFFQMLRISPTYSRGRHCFC